MVYPLRAGLIPHTQPGNEERQNTPRQPSQLLPLDIFPVIPAPSHRRVTVTDMQRLRPDNNPLAKCARTAQNQVISAQIQVLHRKGIERQVGLVMLHDEGKLLHKRSAYIDLLKGRIDTPGIINRGIEGSFGEKLM